MGAFLGANQASLKIALPVSAAAPATVITWSTDAAGALRLYVSHNGGPRQLVFETTDKTGSQSADWVNLTDRWDFALVEMLGGASEAVLATAHIDKGVVQTTGIAPPSPPPTAPPPSADLLAPLDQLPGGRWPWIAGAGFLLYRLLMRPK